MRVPAESDLHGFKKLFITPDSSDWNPHGQYYEYDEQSMLDFDGNMSKPSRRSMHQVVFEDKDDDFTDFASTMSLAHASDWGTNSDANDNI